MLEVTVVVTVGCCEIGTGLTRDVATVRGRDVETPRVPFWRTRHRAEEVAAYRYAPGDDLRQGSRDVNRARARAEERA